MIAADREALLALAERVENASEGEQRAMLRLAFAACFPTPPSGHLDRAWSAKWSLFDGMLDAYAFESAAMSLVPEGYDWAVFHTNGGLTLHAWCGSREDVFAATPALALTAAALRAHASEQAALAAGGA